MQMSSGKMVKVSVNRMNTYRVFGMRTPEESQREKKHRELARQAAAEGMVLLKNEGVLPVTEKKIALYGAGARWTVRGGTGSGDMHERRSVSIEDGLKNAGYQIVNPKWLDRFDQEYFSKRQLWKDGIEEKIKGYTMENVLEMFEIISSIPFHFPVGSKIQEDEISEGTETAVYVVARQAGEGEDRKVEPGDFLLDETELYNIRLLAERYHNFLLVINCGGMIDLSFMDEIPGIKAVLFAGQGGTETGSAFADLVSGRISPCGKLADTWAMRYEDYPSAEAYRTVGPECEEEDYTEDIYVGYRYFSSFGIKPRYEFGYGLSYTTFSYQLTDVLQTDDTIKISVTVRNTGTVYSGKEVIQVYAQKPWGRLDHEKISLMAFCKTKELAPQESEEIQLEFCLRDLASYDQEDREWFLEKGEYGIYLGTSSRKIKMAFVLVAETEVVIEKNEHICPLQHRIITEKPDEIKTVYDSELARYMIRENSLKCQIHDYTKPEGKASSKAMNLAEQLSVRELACLCTGGGQFGKTFHITPGAVGWTTMELLDKGIPNVNFADGPAGLRLETESVIEPDGTKKSLNALPEEQRWGCIREMEPYALGDPQNGVPVYQYMTAWPAEHVQAQTWNPKLLVEIGRAVGCEMIETGIGLWLAPAMNIHRNPLCGRNFEYYSEDPYLSAVMASAVTEGVQKQKGIGVTVKHFCCNNRETNRNHISANVSERALREVYLRGFRMVVENAHPKAVMSSYNRVNGKYVVNSYDLLTKVLRCEWGYEGLVMSDWSATGTGKGSHEDAPGAGNNLIMPGDAGIVESLVKAVEESRIKKEDLLWCALHVLNLIFESFTSEGF